MCPGKAGDFPSGKNPEDHLFMICITFHFTKEKKSLLNVCIVSKPCEAQDNLYTIERKSYTSHVLVTIP